MYRNLGFLRISFLLLFSGILGILPTHKWSANALPHLAVKTQSCIPKSLLAVTFNSSLDEGQAKIYSIGIRQQVNTKQFKQGNISHFFEQPKETELAIADRIIPNTLNNSQDAHFNWFVLQDSSTNSDNSEPSMLDSWGGISRGCSERPDGFGFPGFPPGSSRSAVEQMLGTPAEELPGYWSNTIALVYQLVPGQVSLGLLFDQNTQILAQTEASFDVEMGIDALFNTFNTMIGCRLDEKLRQGVRSVWSGEREVYDFNLGQIRGTIQWETSSRIYIGVWRSGLHSSLTRREFEPK